MTIIEKIFSRGAGEDVAPGDYVWSDLDLVAMRDFGGPNVVMEFHENFKDHPVFNKNRVAITFDLHIPARTEKVAVNQKILREFASHQGVRLFDVNTGVGQHVLLERGLVKPGDIIVGTDSHMNLLGAIGAAGFGMGTTDIVGALYKGRLWFRVPETIKIIIDGKLKNYVTAKDVILHVLKHVKTDGALHKSVEFAGTTVKEMNLSERITIASMVTEMSGDVGLIEPDQSIMTYIASRAGTSGEPIMADTTARYVKVYRFSVEDLVPQIACPHSPDNVCSVEEAAGTKVDQVFIGSCTNGRFDDLEIAGHILKGRKIARGMRLIIVPATTEVAQQALQAGLYEMFFKSGAVITNPGCALCTTGHPGILAPNEVMVSTSNRNFIGKLGRGAQVYLASPATAAATALSGKITDPRTMLYEG